MGSFYVYAWYYISTGHVFHIGKGTGNRCFDTKHRRNEYFRNVIAKHGNDVAVKKIAEGLTEEAAWNLERKLIAEGWAKGECETNLHEGGRGGNTGRYDSEERSRKLSDAGKKRIGEKNSNFGRHWTDEQKAKQSERLRNAWRDDRDSFMTERRRASDESKKGLKPWNAGKTYSIGRMKPSHYKNMMLADCKYRYVVSFGEDVLYECLGHSKLNRFAKEELGLSRTIVKQLVDGSWVPTFRKHLPLARLKIERLENGKNATEVERRHEEAIARLRGTLNELH